MSTCRVVEIVTPKKFKLNGLWFGPKKPKRVVVWVHGLGSSVFSMLPVVKALADTKIAVLAFNNRGHDVISRLSSAKKKKKPTLAGAAHEVFTECIDDIQGAISFVRGKGVKEIYLAGHSTGCQKSVYFISKTRTRPPVKGLILVAPVSDYASARHLHGARKIERATKFARGLVRRGKQHELLPSNLWSQKLDDAQRFLSLYTPQSSETIFTYDMPKVNPATYKRVEVPMLVVWAEKDEYADRSAKEIIDWFKDHAQSEGFRAIVVSKVGHNFHPAEKAVASHIRRWISA